MACEAISNAIADSGLEIKDIDGMTSYQVMDSCSSNHVSNALGMRLNYSLDIIGGGSSPEALIAHTIGLLEGGYCKAMVIFRSMNGRTFLRMGGQAPTGPAAPTVSAGDAQFSNYFGMTTPAQMFGMSCMRHMHEYGTTSSQLGEIAKAHRYHATLNPKAYFKTPITIEDHQNSRWISKPFHLLDCCLETDVACAMVIVAREQAMNLRHPPVFIMGGTARTMSQSPAWLWGRPKINVHSSIHARNRAFGMSGISHKDVDIISSYDAFTYTTLLQFEGYGFAPHGEGGDFVSGGRIMIDGELPSNLSGGHLSEGYTHGIQMVVENVRQLRGRADDYCENWMEGEHTYDRSKGCRQTHQPEIAMCLGWGSPSTGSSVVLRR
jgi:acetyl-CoA acetyltransferase